VVGLRTVGGAVGPGSAVGLVVLVRAVVAGPLSGVSVSISPQDRAESHGSVEVGGRPEEVVAALRLVKD